MASIINRANQLNPNNWRFWKSRGHSGRPSNWEALMGYEVNGSSCCGGCCNGCVCKYFFFLLVCLALFLVFYVLAKGLGNSTKVVFFGNDSIAMSGTGMEFPSNLTNMTGALLTTTSE